MLLPFRFTNALVATAVLLSAASCALEGDRASSGVGDGAPPPPGQDPAQSTCDDSDGHHTLALSIEGPCGDACDPECQLFDEQPAGGISLDPTLCTVSPYSTDGGDLNALPSGHVKKLLHDSCHGKRACVDSGDCSLDHACNTGNGCCEPHANGNFDGSAGSFNYTLRVPCQDKVIVCNRGNVVAPAGARVTVINGNSNQLQNNLGKCSGLGGSVAGSCTTVDTIDPGACILVSGCEAWITGGTKHLVVNSADFPPLVGGEADCKDNHAMAKGNAGAACTGSGPALTESVPETYTASCGAGQRPEWRALAYDTDTPNGSTITLDIHSADPPTTTLLPNAPCADCIRVADIPASDQQSCPMSGPGACPIDLSQVQGTELELIWNLTSSPSCTDFPVLTSWQVSYTCVDAE